MITITVTMENTFVAAEAANMVSDQFSAYILDYLTEKVMNDLDFVKGCLDEIGIRFRTAQVALAVFCDVTR